MSTTPENNARGPETSDVAEDVQPSAVDYVRDQIGSHGDEPVDYSEVRFDPQEGGPESKRPFLAATGMKPGQFQAYGAVVIESVEDPEPELQASEPAAAAGRCPITGHGGSATEASVASTDKQEDEAAVKQVPEASFADGPTTALEMFQSGAREHDGIFSFGKGPDGRNIVVIAKPEAIQTVLKGPNYQGKNVAYDGARLIFGEGLFTSEGALWKQHRRIMSPPLRNEALHGSISETIAKTAVSCFDELQSRVGEEGGTIDVLDEMTKVTAHAAMSVLLGEGMGNKYTVDYEAVTAALGLLGEVTDPNAMNDEQRERYEGVMGKLNATIDDVVSAGRAHIEANPDAPETVLSALLKAKDQDGQPLADQEIRDEAISMLVGGYETTALTMAWLFELTKTHPEMVQRMSQEVDGVLGDKVVSADDVNQLTYTNQMLSETLRLRPAAPVIARVALNDDVLMGHKINGGDVVMSFIWGAHHDSESWDDPEQFNPDRFANGGRTIDKRAYFPFSIGSRACLGKGLALQEMPMLLATFMQRFEPGAIEPSEEVEQVLGGTLFPAERLQMHITPRNQRTKEAPAVS